MLTAHVVGRTLLEVLGDFKSVRIPLEWLLQAAPRFKPRRFSIASSFRAHPHQVSRRYHQTPLSHLLCKSFASRSICAWCTGTSGCGSGEMANPLQEMAPRCLQLLVSRPST